MRYLEQGDALPDSNDLGARVVRALERARADPGDVLVFLPGKAEIEACRSQRARSARRLRSSRSMAA